MGQMAALAARLERLKAEQARAEQQARDLRDELERARTARKPAGDQEDRVVALARRTADEYLRDAGDTARSLLVIARTKADRLTSDAALRASTIDSDARHRHTEAVSDLVDQRAAALAEIDRLTEVARTCRDRLELQVTRRLRDLGGA
ncbi:hypothetical protein GCM10025331_57800 [Actinoplanes utahensis]|nr:hypothetical protein Aut01nite_58680 [Actinoplanes utahensis]